MVEAGGLQHKKELSGIGEMTQWVKWLLYKFEDPSSVPMFKVVLLCDLSASGWRRMERWIVLNWGRDPVSKDEVESNRRRYLILVSDHIPSHKHTYTNMNTLVHNIHPCTENKEGTIKTTTQWMQTRVCNNKTSIWCISLELAASVCNSKVR